MTAQTQKLLEEALVLSADERAHLAFELIASVDGEADADVAAAWAVEIEQRARRVMAHGSRGSDWESVRARIESKRLVRDPNEEARPDRTGG